MALEQTITADDHWFVGEDKDLVFTIYTDDTKTAIQDVTGWALRWRLRKSDGSPVLIEKTSGGGGIAVSGVFNADPAVNTQKVTVTILDTDTDPLMSGTYRQRLVRTDDGFETVLTFGDVELGPAS
jgi:hypothetical protein